MANHYPARLVTEWHREHEVRKTQISQKGTGLQVDQATAFEPWSFEQLKEEIRAARADVPADGHCLLHCVSKANGTRLEKIKSLLLSYTRTSTPKLKDFLQQGWQEQLKAYVVGKVWSNNVVDLVPVILSELLGIGIRVITNTSGKATFTKYNDGASKWITLILENSHYNYVISDLLSEKIARWLHGNNDFGEINESPECERDYRKPTLILQYKSDVATKKITDLKKNLACGSEFNIVFKSVSRLLDIVKRVRIKDQGRRDGTRVKLGDIVSPEQVRDLYGAVYMATCKICREEGLESCYIGESGRPLATRMKEHCRPVHVCSTPNDTKISAIGQHSFCAHGIQPSLLNWEFKILRLCEKTQDRKALEAQEIRNWTPGLNRDAGVHIII